MWAFLRSVRTNPIYLREQGRWGEPNRYYATMMRYLPLVLLLILGLSVFCGYGQLTTLLGLGDAGGALFALICIPNIIIQMITWVGIIIAPALTAPSIVEELDRGSWDILRLTPMPTTHIIFAKLLGGLSRLRIWIILFITSIIYAAAVGLGSIFLLESTAGGGGLGWGLTTIVMTLIRPWVEIGFAGLAGLTLSLWTHSARAALIGSYALVLVYRIILAPVAWGVTAALLVENGFEAAAFGAGTLAINVLYLITGFFLTLALRRRAKALDAGESVYE